MNEVREACHAYCDWFERRQAGGAFANKLIESQAYRCMLQIKFLEMNRNASELVIETVARDFWKLEDMLAYEQYYR